MLGELGLLRKLDFLAAEDLTVDGGSFERASATEHFIDGNSDCPPVHVPLVCLVAYHFRSHAFVCADLGLFVLELVHFASEAEVDEFDVAFLVNHNVF